jgi:hypothetical protein
VISNEIRIEGTQITNAITIGKRANQHNSISWSYLNLGSVALIHTKIKAKIEVFNPRIIPCNEIIEVFGTISIKV